MSIHRVRALQLGSIACVLALAYYATPSQPDLSASGSAPAAITAVPPASGGPPGISSEAVKRPKFWMKPGDVQAADPGQFAAYERRIQQGARALEKVPRQAYIALTDPDALRRIAEVKALVAATPTLPGAWAWDEVKAVIEGLGTRVALGDGEQSHLESDAVSEFIPTSNVVLISTVFARTETADKVGSVLIHETTHVVIRQRILALSQLTELELEAIMHMCEDSDYQLRVTNEALAYRNQAKWFNERNLLDILTGSEHRALYQAAAKAEPGDLASLRAYAGALQIAIGAPSMVHRGCGAPYVMRGPSKGQLFYPSDIASDFLAPFLDARG